MNTIKIYTDDTLELTTKKIGELINCYVDGHNFVTIPEEWKQEIDFVPPVPVYTKIGGKYQIATQNDYRQAPYRTYYWIDGTGEIDCPACSGDGLLTGDDGIDYECPRCKGAKKVYYTTQGIPVKGITIMLRVIPSKKEGEEDREILTVKYMITPPGTYITKTISEEDLIEVDEEGNIITNSEETEDGQTN